MKSLQTAIALTALWIFQGCGMDPLVYNEAGALRSDLSLSEVEDASLPSCDLYTEEVDDWSVVPIKDYRDFAVGVAFGQALCFDVWDVFEKDGVRLPSSIDRPTPEPSNPNGGLRVPSRPTPEPSNPIGESSNPEWIQAVQSRPTPEPSTWSVASYESSSERPTPEPSSERPTPEPSSERPTPEPSVQ